MYTEIKNWTQTAKIAVFLTIFQKKPCQILYFLYSVGLILDLYTLYKTYILTPNFCPVRNTVC